MLCECSLFWRCACSSGIAFENRTFPAENAVSAVVQSEVEIFFNKATILIFYDCQLDFSSDLIGFKMLFFRAI